MKTTEQKPTERPVSLGRWLMESKKQTQKEMQEWYQNDPKAKVIFEELKAQSK